MRKRRRVFLWLLAAGILLGLAGVGARRWYQTTRPEYRLRRGQEALRQADVPSAREMARRLESAGHHEHAHLLWAAIHLELGRPNEAVAELNQIESMELRLEAADLYGEWLVRHQTKPVEAERMLRFVLSERPDDLVAHRGLAAIYYDQGAWALAVLHLLRWAELDPHDGRPYRFVGLIYTEMDRPTPAITCYREALQRELTAAVAQEVREELAACLTAQSLYAEALEVLRSCGPRAEEVPRLLALRGECLFGVGRTAEAEALLDQARERFSNSLELLRTRGKLFAAAAKPEEAARLFEKALLQDPHDVTSRHQLALACERLRRPDEAAKHRQALEATREGMLALTNLIHEVGEKPWDAALQQRLAEQCAKMGRQDLARRWLDAAANAPAPGP
jgi:tetratricopeptide (TPR) repeat protein